MPLKLGTQNDLIYRLHYQPEIFFRDKAFPTYQEAYREAEQADTEKGKGYEGLSTIRAKAEKIFQINLKKKNFFHPADDLIKDYFIFKGVIEDWSPSNLNGKDPMQLAAVANYKSVLLDKLASHLLIQLNQKQNNILNTYNTDNPGLQTELETTKNGVINELSKINKMEDLYDQKIATETLLENIQKINQINSEFFSESGDLIKNYFIYKKKIQDWVPSNRNDKDSMKLGEQSVLLDELARLLLIQLKKGRDNLLNIYETDNPGLKTELETTKQGVINKLSEINKMKDSDDKTNATETLLKKIQNTQELRQRMKSMKDEKTILTIPGSKSSDKKDEQLDKFINLTKLLKKMDNKIIELRKDNPASKKATFLKVLLEKIDFAKASYFSAEVCQDILDHIAKADRKGGSLTNNKKPEFFDIDSHRGWYGKGIFGTRKTATREMVDKLEFNFRNRVNKLKENEKHSEVKSNVKM